MSDGNFLKQFKTILLPQSIPEIKMSGDSDICVHISIRTNKTDFYTFAFFHSLNSLIADECLTFKTIRILEILNQFFTKLIFSLQSN